MTGTPICGRIDRQGLLIAADPALLRLQQRAGGALGKPLALPQLARLAAMALHFGHSIVRPLHAADDHSDVEAEVLLEPDADGVTLSIRDWRTRPMGVPDAPPVESDSPIAAAEGWSWLCDAHLRLTRLNSGEDGPAVPANWAGRSLSELFELQPDDNGQFPVLKALAARTGFTGQRARLVSEGATPAQHMTIEGQPLFDRTGGFAGFRGVALVASPPPDAAGQAPSLADPAFGSLPLSDPQFGRRIDGALRGPLSRIIATAETISGQFDGPIRADYARYAGDIAHAGRHLLGLIDDLADLQNIERPGFKAAREAVDLADVARRATGLLQMKAEERGIRIDAPPVGETMPATGEFRRVLQILLNLVGNAIRYSPERSVIWIRVHGAGDHASVTVADQGQGISAEQQAVVFEKFERLGRTDSGGSGLGLYIARRLARAMDGELSVDSAPGQGARFTLTLPAHCQS